MLYVYICMYVWLLVRPKCQESDFVSNTGYALILRVELVGKYEMARIGMNYSSRGESLSEKGIKSQSRNAVDYSTYCILSVPFTKAPTTLAAAGNGTESKTQAHIQTHTKHNQHTLHAWYTRGIRASYIDPNASDCPLNKKKDSFLVSILKHPHSFLYIHKECTDCVYPPSCEVSAGRLIPSR